MAELIAGRYAVQSSLGAGGMGEVFLATDTVLGRRVAIKRIRRPFGSDPDQAALLRLQREAQAAAVVHHPNVVTVHDLISDGDITYIVMEYIEGQTLAALIRERQTVDPETVARIGVEVAAALEAAHRVGVVHRDVKPANILLADDSGTAKLADFGIARSDGDSTLTGTGLLIGSVAFMSPEVANGGRATTSADVWTPLVRPCSRPPRATPRSSPPTAPRLPCRSGPACSTSWLRRPNTQGRSPPSSEACCGRRPGRTAHGSRGSAGTHGHPAGTTA